MRGREKQEHKQQQQQQQTLRNVMKTMINAMDLVSTLNLEAERQYAAQTQRNRVKIEKGHAWLIRLLPFPQGPSRQPFARLAQHWIAGRPVFCKSYTAPDFGGDPDCECPICAVAEEMYQQAPSKDERDEFYQVQARITYRTYCLVRRKIDAKGIHTEMSESDSLSPHELLIPKTSFSDLVSTIDRS